YVPNASVINALSANTSESFNVTASDGSLSDTKALPTNITDTNDTPILATPTAIDITDTAAADNFTTQNGSLSATDAEATTLTYGISGGVDGGTTVSKVGTYGTLTVTKSNGDYSYVPNASAINALSANASESFNVTASDGGLSDTK